MIHEGRRVMAFLNEPRQARRTILLGLAGAACAVLAACQTGPRAPRPGPGPVGPIQPTPAGRHLVALIVPLSGEDGGVGTSISNAAKLALFDTGETSIRLTVYDSTAPGGAGAAAVRAVRDGAGLVLGPLLAEDVRAAGAVARQAGVPMVAFSNDESVAGGGVFIMGFTPSQSINRVVSFARTRGQARFGAMVPVGLYGQRARAALTEAVRRSGGQLGPVETFERNSGSAKAAASRVKARGGVDAILIGDNGRIAAVAAPGLPRAQLLGTELWASDKTLGKTPALRGALYAAAPDARFNQLVTRYRARYAKVPYRLGSLGYDAMLLAARGAKSWQDGRPFPTRTLLDRDGFAGVDGSFRFDRDGIAERLLEVRQVTAGGARVVAPAGTAF